MQKTFKFKRDNTEYSFYNSNRSDSPWIICKEGFNLFLKRKKKECFKNTLSLDIQVRNTRPPKNRKGKWYVARQHEDNFYNLSGLHTRIDYDIFSRLEHLGLEKKFWFRIPQLEKKKNIPKS